MGIIGGMLVKNEADRWILKAFNQMRQICDKVVILDDCSTDNTVEIAKSCNFEVLYSNKSYWEIDELKQRKRLFNALWYTARIDDLILILDADEILHGNWDVIKYGLLGISNRYKTVTFKLYDMWSDTQYRSDKYWNAHERDWPMAVRKTVLGINQWNEQGLHCGRFPINKMVCPISTSLKIKHMGWSTQKDREEKYKRYLRIDPNGEYGILEQYLSILDPDPNLKLFEEVFKFEVN
jgi:glycosyltransferase involved in cell wall biosynthesis